MGTQINHREQRQFDFTRLHWLAFLNLSPTHSQQDSIEEVKLGLAGRSTFAWESFVDFINSSFQIILDSTEAQAFRNISEPDFFAVG